MKRFVAVLAITSVLLACSENNENNNKIREDHNESRTHPVEETLPDSMALKNDSVIVPDTSGD